MCSQIRATLSVNDFKHNGKVLGLITGEICQRNGWVKGIATNASGLLRVLFPQPHICRVTIISCY